jgi:hypothetical protein
VDNTENSFSLNRAHLIYALALPLAALVGFLLAEPMGSNLFIVLCLFGALSLPLLMRWYHFLLLATWNAALVLTFLPGQPPWWMMMTAIGAVIVILNRCVGARVTDLMGGPVARSLLLISLVVVVTAMFTGGAGLRSFGGSSYGGKRYVYLAAAILAYFVMVSRRIPPKFALPVVAIFLLSGMSAGLSELASGPMPFLGYIVPPAEDLMESGYVGLGIDRKMSMGMFSGAIFTFLLTRYGVRGLLDLGRPWRLLLLMASIGIGLLSGFRSALIAQVLILAGLFYLEGLHRTRFLWIAGAGGVLLMTGLIGFSERLPNSVQRSISFLPVKINPVVMADAQGSVDWRTEMWRDVLPEAKRHLLFGKGYLLSPTDLYMAGVAFYMGSGKSSDGSALAGDYHNGPLSLLVPFGIWGFLAFCYFALVSIKVMYGYCSRGRPEFGRLNRLLLACFVARVISFFFMVGAFQTDLTYLIGLVGVAVSLNGPLPGPQAPSTEEMEGEPIT